MSLQSCGNCKFPIQRLRIANSQERANPAAIGLQFFVYNYPFFLLNNQYAAKIRQLFENQTFFLLKSVSVPAFGRVLTWHLAGFRPVIWPCLDAVTKAPKPATKNVALAVVLSVFSDSRLKTVETPQCDVSTIMWELQIPNSTLANCKFARTGYSALRTKRTEQPPLRSSKSSRRRPVL